jgi:hypothetical protein
VNVRQTALIAVIAVSLLLGLTAIHLDRQGPYYDELHQTPAAFRYLHRHPVMFTWAWHGIPLLNMTYSGAIKSNIYGLLLKYGLHQFTITSWRWLGISFVAFGLVAFYSIAGKWIALESALLFPALLLTDITVILTTRHDWGPTALALALRLIFIAIWISIESGDPSDFKFAIAGFITGLSVFEKLSSVVLMLPLFVLLLNAGTRRGRRVWALTAAGLLIGVFPLIIANISSYRSGQGLISLADTKSDKDPVSLNGLAEYAYDYVSLGYGEMARTQIVGELSNPMAVQAEALLSGFALLSIAFAARRLWKAGRRERLAVIFAGMYVTIAIGLQLLPRATFIHHWIVGTPFQYVALALALPALHKWNYHEKVLGGLVLCLIAFRIPAVASIEQALISGQSSASFSPAFNQLIEFAGTHKNDAILVSSDWGSGTQIYCGTNGAENTAFEPYWADGAGNGVLSIAAAAKQNTMYVITTSMSPQFAPASAAIIQAMQTAPDWTPAAPDNEMRSISQIQIRKFVRQVK